MKRYIIPLLLLVALAGVPSAEAQLNIRVSVKFILGGSGQLPSNGGGFGASGVDLTNNAAVTANFNLANELLDRSGRGYRFQLTEVVNVTGWSSFYNLAARSGSNKAALEAVATSNSTTRAQFAWRNNAINIYINNTSSGWCSFPGSGNVIFVGSRAYDTLIIHEIGHYFSLAHTHSGERYRNADNSNCAAANCGCANLIPGNNDGFADTLPDHQCFSRAQIVANNPGATTTQVDNLWLNIMSYHIPQDRFTPDQLDAWTDTCNGSRNGVVTGRTRFVDRTGNVLTQFGSSALPFVTVAGGTAAASSGDIVLVRPGRYNEAQVITKRVTLRATRGNAIIGLP